MAAEHRAEKAQMLGHVQAVLLRVYPTPPILPKLMSSSTPNLGAGGKRAVSTIDPGSRSMCTLRGLH